MAPASDEFGKLFRKYRKRVGLTQRQLAQKLKLDYTYISKIESATVPPPPRDRVESAARVFRLTRDETDGLIQLAAEAQPDVRSWVLRDPRAQTLYRSIRKHPSADRQALLDDLIRQVEKRRKNG